MIITPLGHTEFLVDIENQKGENVRILVDSWLSEYSLGDLMERTVKVRLDLEKVTTIDAIYISHAHTDHIDPYILTKIYGGCHCEEGSNPVSGEKSMDCHVESRRDSDSSRNDGEKPLLILPITLSYLESIFHEYLPKAEIKILANHEIFSFREIEISGHMWPQPEITNEDDVMMLAIANDRELLFAEIDTHPDDESLEAQKGLYRIFTRRQYESRTYIASRNVLDAALPALDMNEKKRPSFRSEFIAGEKERMDFAYGKYEYEEFQDFPRIFDLPGFSRGFIGQGITYPKCFSEALFSYEIFPLPEIASMESDVALTHGYDFPQKALLPGRQYKIENGKIEPGRKECSIGELIRHTSGEGDKKETPLDKGGRGDISGDRLYAQGPLLPRECTLSEISTAKEEILEVLNSRFLPYWSASPVASLREALIGNKDGAYRIGLRISVIQQDSGNGLLRASQGQEQWIIFEYSFASLGFYEVPYFEKMRIDEDYWLDDILDFLEGRQELYSNFWHQLDSKKSYRLWTCIGANFCNNDLVTRKYRFHFERAKSGLTVESFVEELFQNIIK